jgi:CO/xanthine dehydrogenase Mo-binding subunit
MTTQIVGESVKRVDARQKVTGEAVYPGDLHMDGMLHMKVLFSARAHARISSIDASEAEAFPGVVAIFTAKDVPVNEYGLILPDQPVLCGPGSRKPGADIVRTTMDQVALVVAETEEAAAAARELIRVTYEDLPAVFDPFEAMVEGAPQLHTDKPNNILTHYRIRKGDMDAGWAQAEVVVEATYRTSWQEHVFLQPEAGLAFIDEEGRVTVQVAGQWTHEDQEQICHALDLPPEQVRVIYPSVGGAFGGREDMSVQVILALAAWKLRRPVKITWSREESIKGHHKRHPMTIKAKWGATREGKVVAAEVEVVADAGAYAYTSTKVLGNAHLLCTGPYEIPHIKVDTYAVFTNNLPTGAFRGFGGPQGAFAAEGQMSRLAEALEMDPVALRLMNVLHDESLTSVQTPLPGGVNMVGVIEACAEASGWANRRGAPPTAPHKRRGWGFAAGFKNIGFSFGAPEQCTAIIELHGSTEIEEVVLRHAAAEVGQGVQTVMTQMAAEAVGVPIENVRLVVSDTATSENSGSVSASRMTFMSGNAIRGAAEKALEAWQNEERPAVGIFQYRAPKTSMFHPETGESTPNFAYGYVAEAVEAEVDLETGFIDVQRVVCADDVGQAINPALIQGQVEGAAVQALGYATHEYFQMREGHVLTDRMSTYMMPTVYDIPAEVETVIVQTPTPEGPWGARGMGEMPFLPFVGALAAALHEATGLWFDEIPLTPERVVRRLREAGLGTE